MLSTCFWTVVLEETLESPLDSMEIKPVNPKGNQSWIFIGRTDAELKLQYFGHLMQRIDSLEKTLMLGKIEGRRGRGQQRMRWLDGITDSMDIVWVNSRSWWWTGRSGVLQSMGSQKVGHNWVTEKNWTCHCPSLGLEWKLTFSSPVTPAKSSKFVGILSAALSQHHLSGFERAQLEFHHLQ